MTTTPVIQTPDSRCKKLLQLICILCRYVRPPTLIITSRSLNLRHGEEKYLSPRKAFSPSLHTPKSTPTQLFLHRRRILQYPLSLQLPPRFLKRPSLYPIHPHHPLASKQSHPPFSHNNLIPQKTDGGPTTAQKERNIKKKKKNARSIRLISISHHSPQPADAKEPVRPHPFPAFLFLFLARRDTPEPAAGGVVVRVCVAAGLWGGGGAEGAGWCWCC